MRAKIHKAPSPFRSSGCYRWIRFGYCLRRFWIAGWMRGIRCRSCLVFLEVFLLRQREAQQLVDDIVRFVVGPCGEQLDVVCDGLVDRGLELGAAYPAHSVHQFQSTHEYLLWITLRSVMDSSRISYGSTTDAELIRVVSGADESGIRDRYVLDT